MAPPTKLSPEMILALTEAIRRVHHVDDACALVGISERVFYDWQHQAEVDAAAGLTPAESLSCQLMQGVKQARADVKQQLLEVVREAATVKREWLPALSYLGRMDHRWERNPDAGEHGPISITFNVRYTPRIDSEGAFTVLPDVDTANKALPPAPLDTVTPTE